MTKEEISFTQDMIEMLDKRRSELDQIPVRVYDKISKKGAIAAAKELIKTGGGVYEFEELVSMNRLDLSIEAYVIKPKHISLFTFEERKNCLERLVDYGYTGTQSHL